MFFSYYINNKDIEKKIEVYSESNKVTILMKKWYPNILVRFISRIQKIYNMDIPIENISMKYFRLKVDDKPITVKYSNEKYLRSKSFIENNIENISNLDFDSHIQKNKNHCKFCEFNKLCNNQNINYDMISEMEEEDD